MNVALPAPLGLDRYEPELWILVDSEGNPFECVSARDGSAWVIAARSERDVLAAHASMPDHPATVRRSGRAALTSSESLRRSIRSAPEPLVEGWVVFDGLGKEIRREVAS